MPTITLHQFPPDEGVESGSAFCVKVHRLLAFKGLDYSVKNVGSPSDIKRLNPEARKVPVIAYDGELIADSSRIAAFLDERHPEPPLLPADPRARALGHLIEDWADESLYWFAVYLRWQVDTNFEPFARRAFGKLPAMVRRVVPKLARKQALAQLAGQGTGRLPVNVVLRHLDGHLDALAGLLGEQAFLLGDTATLADIAVFGPLRQLACETLPESAPRVRARETLVSWLRRVDQATASEHTVAFA